MSLIFIKDQIENTQYIYTNEFNTEYSFLQCYDWLRSNYKIKYPESLIDLRYSTSNNCCHIFYNDFVVVPGYIWNSKNTNKIILYTLTNINVQKIKEIEQDIYETVKIVENETKDKETRETKDIGVNTETPSLLIVEPDLQACKTTVPSTFENQDDDLKFKKWCKDISPMIKNISKLNLDEILLNELKDKLKSQNYGLKRRKVGHKV